MKTYIGTKIIKAEPMDNNTFLKEIKNEKNVSSAIGKQEGYLVEYDNDYKSWSPKEIFEAAYREVSENEKKIIFQGF